jgi:beta-galactosidase
MRDVPDLYNLPLLSETLLMKQLKGAWGSFAKAVSWLRVGAWPWCLLLVSVVISVSAGTYPPSPSSQRAEFALSHGWRFIRQDVPGAQEVNFDDSAWSPTDLPHTWNNRDGEHGGNDYYRGMGWYRTHCPLNPNLAGRQLFLKFDGAFLVTDVFVNGTHLGQHRGGFAAFVFDATHCLKVGRDNVIAVRISNASEADVAPLSADFTFFGGLYRDVHLLATDPVHISPLDYGSPGVYLRTTQVSSNAAALQVTALVSNASPRAVRAQVKTVVTDADSNIVTAVSNTITLSPASLSNVVASTTLKKPHLWNGLYDPYLYHVSVEVHSGAKLVDAVTQPLGFRYFRVDATNGFFLNGQHYDLHGVSMHQDWLHRGWAIGDAERQANFALLREIGATVVRLSHYQHSEHTYELADQSGIVLWTEIPLVNRITESPAFYANAKQQMRELIRQNYNHPSVLCWGLFNEITMSKGPAPTNLARQLAELVAEEDPTRPSTSAANDRDDEPSNWCSELSSFNKYFGWYNGELKEFGAWADRVHARYPTRSIGISEYGAGANPAHHSERAAHPDPGGPFHPEEYQNLLHESHWQQMQERPFLWCKILWCMFDFASDGRNEGGLPGLNDKGLVTYDRSTRKDAFFYYKANWTTNPMVYITGHTLTNRMTNAITAKVYANCDTVELLLNGASQGVLTSTNRIFTWPVRLQRGTNTVQAVGIKGAIKVSDSLVWNVAAQAPVASMPGPAGALVYPNGTTDALRPSAPAIQGKKDPPPGTPTGSPPLVQMQR